jgi:hypothetical protein
MSAASILSIVKALTDLSIVAAPLLEATKDFSAEDWAELDAEFNSEALKLYAAIARKREAEKG